MNDPNWKWFWRGLGVLAGVFMLVTTLLFWSAWRASAFKASANGQELQSGIDVIAIQLDILSLVIAVVGIGLGFAGFVGYQSIRDSAVKRAEEAAEAEVRNIAPPLIRREMDGFKRTFGKEDPISDDDSEAMAKAAGQDGKEGFDGEK